MLLNIFLVAISATVCVAQVQPPPPPFIFRPCSLGDVKCIGNYISVNSRKCNSVVRGFAPPALTVPRSRFEAPAFNASYVENNLIIRGINKCFVSEFYINKLSGSGVLALDCPGLGFESNRVMYQHEQLREDGVYRYHINGVYPLIRLTTTMFKDNILDICPAFTFAYITALPTFQINPNDLITENFLTRDLSLLDIFERESFVNRAKLLFSTFVNSVICDYGCQ